MWGGVVVQPGRRYRVTIEITYVGGRLPDEASVALTAMMKTVVRGDVGDLSFAVSGDPYSVLTVRAAVRGDSPVDAVTRVEALLDRSLLATGLFEEFDVTGKVLHVAPLERTERIGPRRHQ
jgi:hypothetical protein